MNRDTKIFCYGMMAGLVLGGLSFVLLYVVLNVIVILDQTQK